MRADRHATNIEARLRVRNVEGEEQVRGFELGRIVGMQHDLGKRRIDAGWRCATAVAMGMQVSTRSGWSTAQTSACMPPIEPPATLVPGVPFEVNYVDQDVRVMATAPVLVAAFMLLHSRTGSMDRDSRGRHPGGTARVETADQQIADVHFPAGLDLNVADGIVRDFWAFGEQYDGKYFSVDLDLSPLAGQDVKFVITVLSLGDASGDRALWVQPRITR